MKKSLPSITSIVLFVVALPVLTFSAPAMPKYGINQKTMECSQFFMGDECTACQLPEGWKELEEFECPESFKEVSANSICTPQKTPFCCTVMHSGADGDCEDVVVNDNEKKCAFVDNIAECVELPDNWHRAQAVESWGIACPSLDYQWLSEPLECKK